MSFNPILMLNSSFEQAIVVFFKKMKKLPFFLAKKGQNAKFQIVGVSLVVVESKKIEILNLS